MDGWSLCRCVTLSATSPLLQCLKHTTCTWHVTRLNAVWMKKLRFTLHCMMPRPQSSSGLSINPGICGCCAFYCNSTEKYLFAYLCLMYLCFIFMAYQSDFMVFRNLGFFFKLFQIYLCQKSNPWSLGSEISGERLHDYQSDGVLNVPWFWFHFQDQCCSQWVLYGVFVHTLSYYHFLFDLLQWELCGADSSWNFWWDGAAYHKWQYSIHGECCNLAEQNSVLWGSLCEAESPSF